MREKLIELLQCSPTDIMGNHGIGALADHLIDNNVVPVVRCKDCKYFYRHTQIDTDRGDCWCYGIGNLRVKHTDDYCSSGKRRDNEKKAD